MMSTLAILTFLFFTLSTTVSAAREWSRVVLTDTNAKCLDGSQGAFYILPGVGQGASNFVMHIQGGGWCTSLDDCRKRAFEGPVYTGEPSLGSSLLWGPGPCTNPALISSTPPCSADGGSGGLLSSNITINPDLWDATKIWLGYCSGDSFAGATTDAVPVNNTHSVFFRGDAILRSTFATLATDYNLSTSTSVILKGCSAGGTAVWTQADAAKEILQTIAPNARYIAMPGAGVFLDTPSYEHTNVAEDIYRWLFAVANMSGTTGNLNCQQAWGLENAWRCLFAQNVINYVESDLFVINSLTDLASQSFIMALPCEPSAGNCNAAELAYLNQYTGLFLAAMAPVFHNPRRGGWFVTCSVHMLVNVDGAASLIHVNGATMTDTFHAYFTNSTSSSHTQVDTLWTRGTGEFGGNPDCIYYGPLPSKS